MCMEVEMLPMLTRERMYEQLYFIMQIGIEKENNFKQAGERYRSWAPDRFLL